ncbi:MAG: LssY C-terminal domain-containing protein [Candidatus Omnitrophica bacterium]|nr:LssY C-terminal domain-containing protein [Candidatus Omnitrophota bacterium]
MKKFFPVFFLLAVIAGCASTHLPKPAADSAFMQRAQTKTNNNVTVTVSAMGPKESVEYFGAALVRHNIQPVWIKIANHGSEPYLFTQYAVDPHYYPSAEAAFRARKRLIEGEGIFKALSAAFLPLNFMRAGSINIRTAAALNENEINNTVVAPGAEVSGYVYTQVDEGLKSVPVALMGEKQTLKFNFVIDIPGINPDYENVELDRLMRDSKPVVMDEASVRQYLKETVPCCTKSKNGKKDGDPLNLILVGDLNDILNVFTEAGWDPVEKLTMRTMMKAINAFFRGKGYRYSPVSGLYFDGRKQDLAFQRIRSSINERMHLRLWFTPNQFEGKTVWVGQVSRDIGVKFTLEDLKFTTHIIDPDVDEIRDYIFSDFAAIERVEIAGYVLGVGAATREKPRKNLTDDPYYTDGLRLVIKISDYDVAAPKFLGWQTPWKNQAAAEMAVAAGEKIS